MGGADISHLSREKLLPGDDSIHANDRPWTVSWFSRMRCDLVTQSRKRVHIFVIDSERTKLGGGGGGVKKGAREGSLRGGHSNRNTKRKRCARVEKKQLCTNANYATGDCM